ncbi:MAG: AhpC/TSA family protein [Dysgonamonadaceae bacterium]|jgi:thiol-disulfide isomerase/thioredoxin|nr:AhpC/TSA family protein [Dysgonamonadaceae bacterium]
MKQTFIAIIFLLLLAAGCKKQETVVTGHISGKLKDSLLFISNPMNGTSFWGFADTLSVNADGRFEWKTTLKKPVMANLWGIVKNQYTLLLEPGGRYHIELDSEQGMQQISGPNEKGGMFYASLPNPWHIQESTRSFWNDPSLPSISEQIEKMKNDEWAQWKELADRKEISPSFIRLCRADRDCYYASLEAYTSNIHLYRIMDKPEADSILQQKQALIDNLERIYKQYPPEDESLTVSSFWPDYADTYLTFKLLSRLNFKADSLRSAKEKGIYHTFRLQEGKKYLKGKALEYFEARYFFIEAFQQEFEIEFIALFEQFNKDFPQSGYTGYIKPLIDDIVQYHQIISQPFEKAVFIDHYETIHTLEEALRPLRGKKVYVDVWATWCGPCKAEFKHNEALATILEKEDIQKLYISIDKDRNHQQWLDNIKYFRLEGRHIRADSIFSHNLMKLYSKNKDEIMIAIPWYILVDEEGNIVKEHAKSPSALIKGESLYE